MPINALIARPPNTAPDWDYFQAQENALNLRAKRQAFEDYPEEKNWLREKRGMEREKYGREKSQQPFSDARVALEDFINEIPAIDSLEKYGMARDWYLKQGARPDLFPPVETFQQRAQERSQQSPENTAGFQGERQYGQIGPEQVFQEFRQAMYGMGKKALAEMKMRAEMVGKEKVVGGRIYEPTTGAWKEPPGGLTKPGDYEKFNDDEGNIQYLVKGSKVPTNWKPYEKGEKETDKLTVWPTMAETIKAGKLAGLPKGKVVVAKPAKGGFIYDFESPNLAEEKEARGERRDNASLRKEFNGLPAVKNFQDIDTRVQLMENAYKESKISKSHLAVDQALITLFNKMTDPNSVVMPSEYARTAQDISLWNRIKGKMEKVQQGGAGLTDEDRQALLTMARKFHSTYKEKYRAIKKEYRGYALDYGLDPDKVIREEAAQPAEVQSSAPVIGQTKPDYEFIPGKGLVKVK